MTDTVDRLEAQLRPADAPDQPTEGWSITGLETAAWASRKAAAAHREIARWKTWAEGEKARIDAIVAAETKRAEDDASFFEHHLAAFLRGEIEAGRKTKSLTLPGGTISLRALQPKVTTVDDELIAWAKSSGRDDLVRVTTKEALDKKALTKAAELAEDGVVVIDGEIVPGASWEAQSDSVSFAVNEEQGLFGGAE